MFTEIGIENFKAFGKMQRMPLITYSDAIRHLIPIESATQYRCISPPPVVYAKWPGENAITQEGESDD